MRWTSAACLLFMLLHNPTADQEQAQDKLTVTHEGKTISVLHRDAHSLGVFPLLDKEQYNAWVNELDRKTYKEAQNASFDAGGRIVEGKNGYKLDRRAFLMKYYAYLYETKGPAVIEVPTYPVYPKVDTELLASLRSKQIGYYITYYNAGNRDRSHNIALAAEAIDGTVIFPGERFSFNRVVGIRTTGRGYRRAAVIVRGELSEGVGGGICQVSSTLFNAADRAGLKIVQRYSHSRHVPYVPSGRDATVSWGGPDFVFDNAYNQPVLLRAFAGGGSMAVSILSSDVIEYFPKKVPSISHHLPEEVRDITASQSPGHQKKN